MHSRRASDLRDRDGLHAEAARHRFHIPPSRAGLRPLHTSRRYPMKLRPVAFAVALLVAPAAVAQENPEAREAYMAAHHKMMQTMEAMQPSGDPDKDFATMMIPHHQGAIEMAKIELRYGTDQQLKGMV